MTVPTNAIISYDWLNSIEKIISSDTWLDYYIHDSTSSVERIPEAISMDSYYAARAKFCFEFIGMNTGLKTREVDSDDGSIFSKTQTQLYPS